MLKRFVKALSVWVCVPLVLVAANLALAETPFRITVRLDSGSTLIVEDTRDINLRVGDRVRVENDRIYRM